MNTAIISGSSGSVGVGFAIPVDMIRMIARALIQSGKVSRGSLGLVVQDLTPAIARALAVRITAGALVSQVKPSSPAARAGIKSGDVITRMCAFGIASSNDLRTAVSEEPPGTVVRLAFLRNGREQTANATLVALEEPAAQSNAPRPETNSGPLSGTKTGGIPPNLNRGKVKGVYVADVAPESTAAASGLRPGDIILDADRRSVTSAAQLQNVVQAHPAGRPLLLRIARDKVILFLAIG
jgi:S1-C subfamily serine protease